VKKELLDLLEEHEAELGSNSSSNGTDYACRTGLEKVSLAQIIQAAPNIPAIVIDSAAIPSRVPQHGFWSFVGDGTGTLASGEVGEFGNTVYEEVLNQFNFDLDGVLPRSEVIPTPSRARQMEVRLRQIDKACLPLKETDAGTLTVAGKRTLGDLNHNHIIDAKRVWANSIKIELAVSSVRFSDEQRLFKYIKNIMI
jgi:hypothetical protein